MSGASDQEFWEKLIICIEASAQVIQKYKLDAQPLPHIFDPSMPEPKQELKFWQAIRRNLMSLATVIKAEKVGGSSTVKLENRRHRRSRPQKLDAPPGKRT